MSLGSLWRASPSSHLAAAAPSRAPGCRPRSIIANAAPSNAQQGLQQHQPHQQRRVRMAQHVCRVQAPDQPHTNPGALVGEDAAAFDFNQQSLRSWGIFFGLLTGVLGAIYFAWVQSGLAGDYLAAVEQLTNDNPEATILALLGIFGVYHSGLAGLRPKAEEVIGARAYRVVFALGRCVEVQRTWVGYLVLVRW